MVCYFIDKLAADLRARNIATLAQCDSRFFLRGFIAPLRREMMPIVSILDESRAGMISFSNVSNREPPCQWQYRCSKRNEIVVSAFRRKCPWRCGLRWWRRAREANLIESFAVD